MRHAPFKSHPYDQTSKGIGFLKSRKEMENKMPSYQNLPLGGTKCVRAKKGEFGTLPSVMPC